MESVSLNDSRLPDRIGPGQGDETFPCLDIEFNESAGSVRVYDPRLFRAGRRGFCERLVKAASRQPGISKVEVDLSSASCQIEFSPGSQTLDCMADSFVRAVRGASADSSLLDRIRGWWRRGGWSSMTALRLPDGISLWEAFGIEPAQIRLRRQGVAGNRAQLSRLADALADLDGVEACRVSPWSHSIAIDVCCEHQLSERFLDTVEQELARLKAAELLRLETPSVALFAQAASEVAVASGWKRLMYFALAGGAFSMTLVGLALPGIPTVPFLLAASLYLARSSPRLNERLRHSSFFGAILREWEYEGASSRLSKGKLTGLTFAIVSVTIVVAPLLPLTLFVIVIISSLNIHGIARLPALTEEPKDGPRLYEPARFALPAP